MQADVKISWSITDQGMIIHNYLLYGKFLCGGNRLYCQYGICHCRTGSLSSEKSEQLRSYYKKSWKHQKVGILYILAYFCQLGCADSGGCMSFWWSHIYKPPMVQITFSVNVIFFLVLVYTFPIRNTCVQYAQFLLYTCYMVQNYIPTTLLFISNLTCVRDECCTKLWQWRIQDFCRRG